MKTFERSFARAATLSALLTAAAVSCVDPDSPLIQESVEGCDEIKSSTDVQTVEVEASVRRLMVAAVDFSASVNVVEDNVITACANIALDLGAQDTWSSLDEDAMVSNGDGTGACDQAVAKIEEWLPASAEISLAINYSKGYCYVDYQEQMQCDTECTTDTQCEPGTVETRCEPGELMVSCQAECAAQATCMGAPEKPANCMGMCESECQGECKGTCFGADGKKTENDPNCRGKCSSSCNGFCRGQCKNDVPTECGASVQCKGGCTSTYTDPVCTTTCGPPQCTVEKNCHDVCTSHLWANPVCVPTTVTVLLDVSTHADLEPLRATLERNLPVLIDSAEFQGRLCVDALERLADAGTEIEAEDLDGKSLSCAGESTAVVARELDSIRVSVEASATIVRLCDERTM